MNSSKLSNMIAGDEIKGKNKQQQYLIFSQQETVDFMFIELPVFRQKY